MVIVSLYALICICNNIFVLILGEIIYRFHATKSLPLESSRSQLDWSQSIYIIIWFKKERKKNGKNISLRINTSVHNEVSITQKIINNDRVELYKVIVKRFWIYGTCLNYKFWIFFFRFLFFQSSTQVIAHLFRYFFLFYLLFFFLSFKKIVY